MDAKTSTHPHDMRRLLGGVCAWVTIGLGALALWSWGAGVADLFTTSPRHVPAAPSTALLFILGGAGVLWRDRWHARAAAARFGCGAMGVVGLAGFLAAIRAWFGWGSPLEEWLAQTAERVNGIPLGQMSPLTGITFVCCALAYLLKVIPRGHNRLARRLSAILASLAGLIGAAVGGSYAADRPWLYGGATIPMALWTAAAFVFLSLALLLVGGSAVVPIHRIRRSVGWPLAITGVLAFSAGVGGALHLRHAQEVARAAVRNELMAIADSKVEQIANWRAERLSDARFFSRARIVAGAVHAFFADPASPRALADTRDWLELLKGIDRYQAVALLDPDLTVRLALPQPVEALPDALRRLAAAALRSDRILISDLHRSTSGDAVHMDLVFPLWGPTVPRVQAPQSATALPRRPVGVLALTLDPRRFLYPLIQSWPVPSRTAETLLVRRDGDDAAYLSEPPHRRERARHQWLAVGGHTDDVAVMAVRGRRGVMEALDYRGEWVLAAARDVPNTSLSAPGGESPRQGGWVVVAKIDRDEILAPIRRQAWLTLLLTATIAGGIVLAGNLLWQRREATFAELEWAAERQRLALAERVALLMDHANDLILIADQDRRILEANTRAVEVYGYSADELRGMALRDLCAPGARDAFDEAIGKPARPQGVRLESIHQRKDGATFPVECGVSTTEIDGRTFYQEIVRNIADRKRAEEAREKSERTMRAMFDNARDGIFVADTATRRLVNANPAMCRMLGCSPENIAGLSVDDIHPPDHLPQVRTEFERQLRGEIALARDIPVMRKDGSVVLVDVNASPLELDGRPHLLGVVRDITERKQAEAALLESRNALQTVVETSPLAIIVTDPQGVVTLWNSAAEHVFGWSEQEALGQPNRIIPPDKAEEVRAVRHEILEGTTLVGYETERRRKDGTRIPVSFAATAIRDAEGRVTGVLGIVSDLTPQKRLEAERTRLELQLRQQQKLEAIGTLASGVAHEINNPIAGIMNYAQLIADTVPADHPAAGHAQEIVQEAERVATIVRNLLQFARQEKQTHSPARLPDIVEQTLSLVRAAFRRDQITLTVDVPETLPPLRCRSQQLQQVLLNLLTNARDALNAKYPGYHTDKTLAVTGRPFERDGRPWLRVSVADRGPGIPPAVQDRVFDPFFTTKPRDQGTGLGLAISHGIVKDHGGRLSFENTPGEGTQFHVDLPVDAGEMQQTGGSGQRAGAENTHAEAMRRRREVEEKP